MVTICLHVHVYVEGFLVCDPEYVMRSRGFDPEHWTLRADLFLAFAVERDYIVLKALRFRPNAPEPGRSEVMLDDITAIVDDNGLVLEYQWEYDVTAAEAQ